MGVAKDILQDAGDEPDADLLLENAEQRIYEIDVYKRQPPLSSFS